MLRTLTGGNARRGYGHWLVRHGQTCCAYCGVSLADDYYRWLLLSVDHVIPVSEKDKKEGHWLGIPREWHESYSNIVLACLGCNGFRNRYQVSGLEPKQGWTEAGFFELRDRVFWEKALQIEQARADESCFFEQRVKR